MTLKIVITGKPIAKKRPRFARIGKGVRTYDVQETEEGRFLFEARGQVGSPMIGPLWARMTFYVPRPKGHFGAGKNSGVLKTSAPKFPTSKPDLDNYEKFAMDCLNGLAWHDDAQIVMLSSRKEYADPLDGPRTVINVMRMDVDDGK